VGTQQVTKLRRDSAKRAKSELKVCVVGYVLYSLHELQCLSACIRRRGVRGGVQGAEPPA
jgi:hypothetical protein